MEMMEEKKAETRLKTGKLQNIQGKAKEPALVEIDVEFNEYQQDLYAHQNWLMDQINSQRTEENDSLDV